MTETFDIDGKTYEVTGNPTLRTVREVQQEQENFLFEHIDEKHLTDADALSDESELVKLILDSGGKQALLDVRWERSIMLPRQTISLACDTLLESDKFNSLTAQEFQEIKSLSEEKLGGDANDFFNELGIGISLTEEEIEEHM